MQDNYNNIVSALEAEISNKADIIQNKNNNIK